LLVYVYNAAIYAFSGLVGSFSSILVVIAGVCASWQIYYVANSPIKNDEFLKPVWVGVIGYYLAGIVTAVLNPTDIESIFQVAERLPFLFLPALIHFATQLEVRRLFDWLVIGAAIGALLGLTQAALTFQGIHSRVEGLSGNPNVFGYISNVLLIFVCAGFVGASQKRIRSVCGLAIPAALFLVVLSGSRGSLIAAMVTCLVMVWSCWPRSSLWARNVFLFAALILGVVGIVLTPAGERLLSAYAELTGEITSYESPNGQRLAIWQCGIQIGQQVPIVGDGHNWALEEMNLCMKERFNLGYRFTHFHNIFIDQFAKGGLIGLVGVLLLLGAPVILLLRERFRSNGTQSKIFYCVKGGLISLLSVQIVAGLFNVGIGHDVIDMLFIYTLAVFFGLALTESADGSEPEKSVH